MLSALFAFQASLFAQNSTNSTTNKVKAIKSNASEVTIFLNGAQVLREVSVQIPAGESILRLESLSPYINQNSIQVRANRGLTILSVNYELNHLAKTESSLELENLKKKLEQIQEQLILEKANLSIVLHEISFLQKNRKVAGENTSLTVTALQQAAEYYGKTLTALKLKEIEKNKVIKKISEQEELLKRQIQEWMQDKNIPSGEIAIKTHSPAATTYNLVLTYVVNNAGWTPSYDIRAQSINQPLTIAYKANVTQNTRENWKNIKLRLSSANPNLSGSAPKLNPYHLRYPRPISAISNKLQMRAATVQIVNDNLDLREEASFTTAPTQFIENQTTVEFEIGTPYTINSDGKEYSVDMNIIELPASYQYYSVPKLDKDAFLIAKVTEWEKHNLLEGEANIFFEETFVGKTFLDLNNAKDTLELSLGRDKNISITREKIKEFTTKQFIGSKQEEEISWLITVKNNKNIEANILIADQVPLSTIEEIEVSIKNISQGVHNNQTGEIQWELNLKPLETKVITLTYRVKYPKNRSLIIQ